MEPLQDFGFKESAYERPLQKWICGRAADGSACHVGPTARGRCWFRGGRCGGRVQYECIPALVNGRANCMRPKSQGGKCTSGPLFDGTCSRPVPCQPVRSLRARRGVVAFCIAAGTLSTLFLILSVPAARLAFISPGELGFHHGALATGRSSSDPVCQNCHAATSTGLAGWLARQSGADVAMSQSHLCMDCHDFGDGENALQAHSLPPPGPSGTAEPSTTVVRAVSSRGATARRTELRPSERMSPSTGGETLSLSLARLVSDGPADADGRLACATCHQEHRGRRASMTRMDDAQCQICHAAAFGSFSRGHPDVSQRYAFRRVTHLKFDHVSHYDGTLPDDDSGEALQCVTCHAPDATGRHMVLNDFETSCAECHEDDINTEDGDGIPVFALPRFATKLSAEQRGVLGYWPGDAEGEAELTPYMKLLLLGDAGYESGHDVAADLRVWSRVDATATRGDCSMDDVAAIGRLAAAVRRLVDDLGDSATFQARLERAFGPRLAAADVDALSGGSHGYALVRTGAQNWLADPAAGAARTGDTEGHWAREDDAYTISYHPIEHADRFVKAWLDLVTPLRDAGADGDPVREAARRIFDELAADEAPGQCLKCHSSGTIEPRRSDRRTTLVSGRQADSQDSRVRWHPGLGVDDGWRLTVFSHAPHLSLLPNCTTCHRQNAEYDKDKFLAGYQPGATHIVGSFAPIRMDTCTACHTPERAGDSCLQCHNYHGRAPVHRRRAAARKRDPV